MIKANKQLFSTPFNYGFTLIEILVVISIMGALSLVFYNLLIQSFQVQNFISEQSKAISSAQKGVTTFNKELREAATADDGAYLLDTADEQEIIFYSDIDADTYTEKIRYFIDNGSLKKGVIEPSTDPVEYTGTEEISILSSHIVNDTNPIFIYYNENYPSDTTNNPLSYPADVTDVSLVRIYLEINVNPNKIPETYILDSYVQIRNAKNNL